MKAKIIAALAVASLACVANALADEPSSTTAPATATPPATAPAPGTASASTTASTTSSTTTTTAADVGDTVTPVSAPTTTTTKESVTLYDKHRPNKAYLITGVSLFAGTYATTAAVVGANVHSNDRSMYIPVVGPWLALKDANNYSTEKTLLYAGSGVLQGAGVALAIASFFIPEKTAAVTIQAKDVKMNILPTSYGVGSAGVGAVGTF